MEVIDSRARLVALQAQRSATLEHGADPASLVVARLDEAIDDARVDYVTGAVLEIAFLRRSIAGALHG
jgi:hypothetical protein